MKNGKRILKIELKRMFDESPDTSWLGEYSDKRTSEFSIDRAHDEDCRTQNQTAKDAIEQLKRMISHLQTYRQTIGNDSENPYYWGIDAAIDLLAEKQDDLAECDCGRGTCNHREYRYFNPSFNYVDRNGRPTGGDTPEDIRKYVARDYARMEALQAGEWSFIGIGAEARITIGGTCQTVTSGALWGIESDSDESYLEETEQEQLAELRAILYEMGFSKRAIAAAIGEMR